MLLSKGMNTPNDVLIATAESSANVLKLLLENQADRNATISLESAKEAVLQKLLNKMLFCFLAARGAQLRTTQVSACE
jgi:hypothetical protein